MVIPAKEDFGSSLQLQLFQLLMHILHTEEIQDGSNGSRHGDFKCNVNAKGMLQSLSKYVQ